MNARFTILGINRGLFCFTPSVALIRSVVVKRAFEMLLTGEFIDADTAVEWGLRNQSVQNEELDMAVETLTAAIISKSAAAIRYGKPMFYRQQVMRLEDAYSYAANVMSCNALEEDAIEGIAAFLDKHLINNH
ncbi:enoyl-CoA hydratase-related protein [Pseudomonas sp. C98]|uniref:Enoyl-CoA hydratase domain-containing protein 3, mitochondrial n=2 Tax=Pseudomonas mercuritolerans TaxID=2951809 RepID=A0ABT2XYZ5_9PSED|nr:enoyl-CoA hydratase-related protein [Pseudomonas mercuritolerans]MCV2223921.1 enoyl-CoA hydratase-related protein [Pseudomonas mercuritolerans]